MNNESKCCEKCREFTNEQGDRRYCRFLRGETPICPCHDTSAPEDWEKEFDRDHKPQIQSRGEDCKAVVNLKAFIRSEKAAARREGAERACDYIESKIEEGREPGAHLIGIEIEALQEMVRVARSEGVNV